MGEGEGVTDVTDQLDSAAQLEGLRDDKPTEPQGPKPPPGKEEEERPEGLEMDTDFDAPLEAMPPPDAGEEDGDDDGDANAPPPEERFGDGGDGDAVDEKLWGEDDENVRGAGCTHAIAPSATPCARVRAAASHSRVTPHATPM
ncbi:hypothetical protein T492DRAFT_280655 [Pavlovales sp. CCMP2436]|nr:hypothetical protein T492DRAFT_280655 [Pavlovales sp. CCMP2436]